MTLPPRHSRLSRFLRLLAPVLPLLCASAAPAATHTPAGTLIRNQAVLEFEREDDTGGVFTTTSNEVLLEVLPVYGIQITPDTQGQGAISSITQQRATFAFRLLFTGNETDQASIAPTFDATSDFTPRLPDGGVGILIYNDLDNNGVVDTEDVLVASWRDANANNTLEASEVESLDLGRSYEPDESADLLATFYVPSSLGAGAELRFGIDGASVADPTKQDNANLATLTIIDDALVEVTKDANVQAISPGGTFTYTVTATSVGSAAARQRAYTVDATTYYGVLVWDEIPREAASGDPLPVTNPGFDLGNSETGIFIYSDTADVDSDPQGWTWTATWSVDATVIAFLSSGNTSAVVADDLDPGEVAEFSFDVTIPASATEQVLSNTGHATYMLTGGATATVESRNAVLVAVTEGVGVVIRDTDFESPRPSLTAPAGANDDIQTVPTAQAGATVTFVNRVLNTGVNTDTFNLSIDPASVIPGAPSGWNVAFFKSDGKTPLRDTGTDGIIDTGPLAPHGGTLANPQQFADIVVRITIPEAAPTTTNDPGDPVLRAIVVATSVANRNHSDTTQDDLTNVSEANMAFANFVPPNPDPSVLLKTADKGGYVDFPLIVQNTAPASAEYDTYTLSTPVLRTGWYVVYYLDANGNGQLEASEALPIANTPPVAPQGNVKLVARVIIPADELADADGNGTQDVYGITFRATSQNLPTLFSDQADQVRINWGDRFELRPDRQGTVEPGGAVVYDHVLINHSERALAIYVDVVAGHEGWTYRLLGPDGSTAIPQATDPADSVVKYTFTLGKAGSGTDTAPFVLRIFCPATTAKGVLDVTSLDATAVDPEGDPATDRLEVQTMHTAVDVTLVALSELVLIKTVSPDTATRVSPGEELTYTTTFKNKGAGPITQVVIGDQIPGNTWFRRGSVTVSHGATVEVSRDGGITWEAAPGGSGRDEGVTNVRAVLTNPLPPGESGTFVFAVEVQ